MIKGGTGGNSTKTGATFEKKARENILRSIQKWSKQGFSYEEIKSKENGKEKLRYTEILYKNKPIAFIYEKNELYSELLKQLDGSVDWKKILSKNLFPDSALYNMRTKELHIIEVKYQTVGGSVDEKLQTCDFKKKQYTRLLSSLNIKVQYTYVLNDFFKNTKYTDVLEYIKSMGCNYFFNEIPIEELGLVVDEA